MERYREIAAKKHFEHAFRALRTLTGVVRIKVFNPDKMIIWSDAPDLIGTYLTGNLQDLARALDGEVRAVFDLRDTAFPSKSCRDFR